MACRHLIINGRVQGVGYRYWLSERAQALGIDGWVRNNTNGEVEAYLCGNMDRLVQLTDECKQGPSHASVGQVVWHEAEDKSFNSFTIR